MNKKAFIATIILIIHVFIMSLSVGCNNLPNQRSKIKVIVGNYFQGSIVLPASTLDQFAREFFNHSFPCDDPYVVRCDFDGNGFLDLACLIKSGTGENSKINLTVLLQQPAGVFLPFNCLEMEYRTDVFITSAASGTILKQAEAIDSSREDVPLNNPAIKLVYVGKSAVVYYWDARNEIFDFIWIAD